MQLKWLSIFWLEWVSACRLESGCCTAVILNMMFGVRQCFWAQGQAHIEDKGATNTLSESTWTDGGYSAKCTCGTGANDRGTAHAPWCTDHTSYCANLCNQPFHSQWHLNIAASKASTSECGIVITVIKLNTQGTVSITMCNDSSATGTATVMTIARQL